LSSAHERAGDSAKTAGLLDQAQRELGDRVELRLARSRLALKLSKEEGYKSLLPLEKGLERFGPEDQALLLLGLADCYYRMGKNTDAQRCWSYLAKQHPNDLRIRGFLFDLALQKGNEGDIQYVLDDIRRIDGINGTMWRFAEAQRLVWRARKCGEKTG